MGKGPQCREVFGAEGSQARYNAGAARQPYTGGQHSPFPAWKSQVGRDPQLGISEWGISQVGTFLVGDIPGWGQVGWGSPGYM